MRSAFDGRSNSRFVACLSFVNQIAWHRFIELQRAGRQRIFGVRNRLQRLVFDFNQFGGIGCGSGAIRHHQRYGLADKTNLAMCQHRPVQRARLHAVPARSGQHVRDSNVPSRHGVCTRENLFHTRMSQRICCFYRNNFSMRVVGAHKAAIQLPRCIPVRSVGANTRDETEIFYPFAVMMMIAVRVETIHGVSVP